MTPARAAAWLVARGGVSRLALFAAAAGLGVAGYRPWPVAPCALLTGVIAAACAAAGAWARSPGRRAGAPTGTGVEGLPSLRRWAAAVSPFLVVVMAAAAGLTVGSARMAEVLDGRLARAVRADGDARFDGEVVVVGVPRERGSALVVPAGVLDPVGAGERVLLEIEGDRRGSAGVGAGAERGAPALDGIHEGAIVEVTGRLRAPRTPPADAAARGAGGGFDETAWLRSQGIASVLVAPAGGIRVVGARAGPAGAFDRLRVRARSHLAEGLDPAMGGLLRGFALGDKSGIPEETLEAFRRAGTAHLLAVSGLHVGSLAAAVLLAARAAAVPPALRAAAAGAAVGFFAALTGGTPSVVRATVMVLAVLGAGLLGRGRDAWTAVALAAVVVLGRDPPAVTGAGFQLSFSAVVALLLLAERFEGRLQRHLPSWAATGVAISLAASLGTAPVSLATFGRVSVVGIVANPVVVPVVPVVMALGMASMAVGLVWMPMCAALNAVSGVVLGYVVVVSEACARAPVLTAQHLPSVVAAAVGGALAWAALRRRRQGRRDGSSAASVSTSGRRSRPGVTGLAAVAAGALVGVVFLGATVAAGARVDVWWAARSWPEGGEVRVMDVGEGAAVLVRSPDRAAVLVDAGPPGQGLAGGLRDLGVGRLDAVVITHPHLDHYGGMGDAVRDSDVGVFVDHVGRVDPGAPAPGGEAAEYLRLREECLDRGARHFTPRAGEAVEIGDVRLEFLAPARPLVPAGDGWAPAASGATAEVPDTPAADSHTTGGADPRREGLSGDGLNRASLVVVVRVGGLVILVPGDAEADVLARYPLPDIDVLVVPHHGSDGAVSARLLDESTPALAVVPVGAGNRFGHPAAGTLEVLLEGGVPAFRTDRRGWVAVRPLGSGGWQVLTAR